jgi:hypothetical protein
MHPGNTNRSGRLSTVDLHSFCKKVNYVFNFKSSGSKLVSTRRSIVLSLSLQLMFPDAYYKIPILKTVFESV